MFFYLPEINQKGLIEGDFANHFNSLRVSLNQIVKATDFKGSKAVLKITKSDHKKKFYEYELLSIEEDPKPRELVLYQAILDKNYLEKLVEILPHSGFNEVVFFDSQFSLKIKPNLERLGLILQRSCCQAECTYLPKLRVLGYNEVIAEIAQKKPLWLEQGLATNKQIETNFTGVLVGCEGGFSLAEKEIFEKMELLKISLGNKVFPGWLAGSVLLFKTIT